MKTIITDAGSDYKAYQVRTDNGSASKGKTPNYDRAVDIGVRSTVTLDSSEAQRLFGDTQALTLVNPDGWPGNVTLMASDVKLVTLSTTFNELCNMAAKLSAANGGVKLSKIRNRPDLYDTSKDGIVAAFEKAAAADGLTPLGNYFVTSRSMLESFTDKEIPETEDGMGDRQMDCPNEVVAVYSDAGRILADIQPSLLFNECDFPGYASGNRYYITGLFMDAPKPAILPIAKQSGAPINTVFPLLQKTLV